MVRLSLAAVQMKVILIMKRRIQVLFMGHMIQLFNNFYGSLAPTAQFTHNFWNFYITPFIITEREREISYNYCEKKHQTYQHQSEKREHNLSQINISKSKCLEVDMANCTIGARIESCIRIQRWQ